MTKALLYILLPLLLSLNVCHAESLVTGWEKWYPFQFKNEQGELTGVDIEIFKAIVTEAGIDTEYVELPWKRHVQQLESGDVQIAMGASKTIQRNKFAYFTKSYRTETVNLYVLKGKATSIKLDSLEDINHSNYMIGIEGGYYYGEKYQRLSKSTEFQSHINEVIDIEQNIKLLKQGHIDGFLADPATLNSFVKQNNFTNQFEKHPLVIHQTSIHIMLSKKSTSLALLKRFNTAITNLTNNQQISLISQKWFKEN